jgi:hypothetical protein
MHPVFNTGVGHWAARSTRPKPRFSTGLFDDAICVANWGEMSEAAGGHALPPLWQLASEGTATSRGRSRRLTRTAQCDGDRLVRGLACSMCYQSKVCEERGGSPASNIHRLAPPLEHTPLPFPHRLVAMGHSPAGVASTGARSAAQRTPQPQHLSWNSSYGAKRR